MTIIKLPAGPHFVMIFVIKCKIILIFVRICSICNNICNTTAFLVTYDHHQVASWATFCCSSFFLSSKDSHLGKEFCLEIYVDYHTLISYKCLHEIYFINKREGYWSSIASFVNFLQCAFQSFPRNHIHVDDLKPNMRKNLFFQKQTE